MVIFARRLAPASITVHTEYSCIELLHFCKIDAAAESFGTATAARLIVAAARTIFAEVCMLGSYFRRASPVTIAGGCDQNRNSLYLIESDLVTVRSQSSGVRGLSCAAIARAFRACRCCPLR